MAANATSAQLTKESTIVAGLVPGATTSCLAGTPFPTGMVFAISSASPFALLASSSPWHDMREERKMLTNVTMSIREHPADELPEEPRADTLPHISDVVS